MAYDEFLADRIRQNLTEKSADFDELKMMGGLCFRVDGKMLCGIHIEKESKQNLLMCRIGEAAYETEVTKACCLPMDFTGRPMKGYVFVTQDGFDLDDQLDYWIIKCLEFNPHAKASKKKK
jgi:hypothetical protein